MTTVEAICPECGSKFEYEKAEAFGRQIFKPVRCWDCADAMREAIRQDDRARLTRAREQSWENWRRDNFPAFDVSFLKNCDSRIRAAGATWTEKLPTSENLGLIGPTGTGKTTVAVLCLREAHMIGASIAYLDALKLAKLAQDRRFANREEQQQARHAIREAADARYLLLDDIGQGPANGNEDSDALLFELVKERYERKLSIIWTCQGNDHWLRERLGPIRYPAIERRLTEAGPAISLFL